MKALTGGRGPSSGKTISLYDLVMMISDRDDLIAAQAGVIRKQDDFIKEQEKEIRQLRRALAESLFSGLGVSA